VVTAGVHRRARETCSRRRQRSHGRSREGGLTIRGEELANTDSLHLLAPSSTDRHGRGTPRRRHRVQGAKTVGPQYRARCAARSTVGPSSRMRGRARHHRSSSGIAVPARVRMTAPGGGILAPSHGPRRMEVVRCSAPRTAHRPADFRTSLSAGAAPSGSPCPRRDASWPARSSCQAPDVAEARTRPRKGVAARRRTRLRARPAMDC
jgi:hypothetical protein